MAKPKKLPYAKGRAFCIYCGTHEDMSEEHIWAEWLRAYVPRELPRHKAVFKHIHPDPTKSSVDIRKREGDPYARKLRVACRACNHGWMSKVQQLTKPFLVPPLFGNPVSLYKNGQTAIAAWATMFVMTADFLDKSYVSISAKERQWLKDHRRPPNHWRIWIGKYDGPRSGGRWYHTVLTFAEDEKEIVPGGTEPIGNTQTSTILLGDHLIIHIMSSRIMRRLIKRWQLLPAVAPALTQIWPVIHRRVDWPVSAIVPRVKVEDLAFHFFNRCDTVARKMERDDG